MRPLRLLLSLCSSFLAVILLLYLVFGSHDEQELRTARGPAAKGKVKALFSFTSPSSLFPPSAIISLTDDNSTFFLARPAAFGPALPSDGLSGPLWIGEGFGDDGMGKGELGCSDVPGWDEGDENMGLKGLKTASDAKAMAPDFPENPKNVPQRRPEDSDIMEAVKDALKADGTDDHLHLSSGILRPRKARASEHADIQSLQESAEIAGKVVLLKRGGCGFLEKVKWAQNRGGVALIVGDDVRGGGLVRMYAHGDTSNVTIPALFTSYTTAHLLSSLLPSGGFLQDLTPEEVEKLKLIKNGKGGKKDKEDKTYHSVATQSAQKSKQTPKLDPFEEEPTEAEDEGFWRSVLAALGSGSARKSSKGDNSRPPSSGSLDWALVENWDDEGKTLHATPKPTPSRSDNFVIGEQDWRDPDLLPTPTPSNAQSRVDPTPESRIKGGNAFPSSGEYVQGDGVGENRGWLSYLLGGKRDNKPEADTENVEGSSIAISTNAHSSENDDAGQEPHEGLWVTLTPTNMSTSPFFDTLLVLVVSPLVTLTVVYALLLLRSRIRRRRWRAPKSLVERLPVRTYHTISDSSPSATPGASSPTTPLLQRSPSRPPSQPPSSPSSSLSRPRSRTESEVPATSSSSSHQNHARPAIEKRDTGMAEWRRRYGGRQKECVVCLEEYVDGISRVMSLPCGHEFHADCITPWLVTRRRTCPICKGDVVRSLSQSYHDRTQSSPTSPFMDDADDIQAEAAETRNDSPSASRPVPISAAALEEDIEANWDDEDGGRGRDSPRDGGDLSSSLREVSSSVVTTIWRGFEAVGRATGLQRRPSREEVDRDR